MTMSPHQKAVQMLDHVWQYVADDVIACLQYAHLPEDREATAETVVDTVLDKWSAIVEEPDELLLLRGMSAAARRKAAEEVGQHYYPPRGGSS